MTLTIEIPEKIASLLARQAAEHGVTVEAWVGELAQEKARTHTISSRDKARAAVDGILALQKDVKPDPEGWTVRDYIEYGRR